MKGRGWEGPTKPRWSARGPFPWEKVITRSDLPQRDSPCLVKKSSLDPVFVTPDFKEALRTGNIYWEKLRAREKFSNFFFFFFSFSNIQAFNDNCPVIDAVYLSEVNICIVAIIIVKIIVVDRCSITRINWKKSSFG